MKKSIITLLASAALLLSLVGCGAPQTEKLIVSNLDVDVDEKVLIDVVTELESEVSYSFDGDAIAIYDGRVRGMVAGTTTEVTASAEGYEGQFTVTVSDDSYVKNEDGDWFSDITVEAVPELREDFAMGMDISTLKTVLDGGGRFYDSDGKRISVFRLLADNGVNWIRLRLWNEPYQLDENGEKVYYGGGNCDFDTIAELARDTKALGFKLLLDFHYSDFWADPSDQIIPKMWADIKTEDAMALAIYDYTYETLDALIKMDARPDMVQLGNELTSGMLLQTGGEDDGSFTGSGYSGYAAGYTYSDKAVRAPFTGRGADVDARLVHYINSGADAVKALDDSMLIMLQLAKGMDDVSGIKAFFNTFEAVPYDVIGLSYYPRWHGDIDLLRSALTELRESFPDKELAIVELSYAFTYDSASLASNQFNASYATDDYEVSVQGQADFVRDVIAAVAAEDGFGIFYWEGAWLPVSGAGWAGPNTLSSWANQALFSYDGMVLPSLSVFRAVYG